MNKNIENSNSNNLANKNPFQNNKGYVAPNTTTSNTERSLTKANNSKNNI